MKTKKCIGCGRVKPVTAFYKSPDGDGYRGRCGACHYERQKVAQAKKLNAMTQEELDAWAKKQTAKARRWDTAHPHGVKARRVNQRAKAGGIKGRITAEDVERVRKAYAGKCWICGDDGPEIDHYIPTNKKAGGTNTADNIRPICLECNRKRSYRWLGPGVAEKEAALLRQLKELFSERSVP